MVQIPDAMAHHLIQILNELITYDAYQYEKYINDPGKNRAYARRIRLNRRCLEILYSEMKNAIDTNKKT